MTNTRPYRLAVFDFDGTLADTFGGIRLAVDAALAEHGLPPSDPTTLRASVGLTLGTVFRRLLAPAPHEAAMVADLVATYRRLYAEHAASKTSLYPGVHDLLDRLRNSRVTMAIATSKSGEAVRSVLQRLAIADHFASVCSDELVTAKKPHPEMLHVIGEKTGIAPRRMLMIGDTGFDIAMGNAAGAGTCAVTWGNQSREQLLALRPTYVVDQAAEICPLLIPEAHEQGAHLTRRAWW